MGENPIKIRLATIEDVEALTELHCSSFKPKDHVPVMIGRRYVRANYHWLVSSAISYVLVAEKDDRIIGLTAVADRPFTGPMFKACLGVFILSVLRRPHLLLKANLWRRLLRKPKVSSKWQRMTSYPGMAQMTIGVVDANYRGEGVFPLLVDATRQYSKDRGSRAIHGGLYKINQSSRRVFIKSNWTEITSLETPDTVFYVTFLDSTFPAELGLEKGNYI